MENTPKKIFLIAASNKPVEVCLGAVPRLSLAAALVLAGEPRIIRAVVEGCLGAVPRLSLAAAEPATCLAGEPRGVEVRLGAVPRLSLAAALVLAGEPQIIRAVR